MTKRLIGIIGATMFAGSALVANAQDMGQDQMGGPGAAGDMGAAGGTAGAGQITQQDRFQLLDIDGDGNIAQNEVQQVEQWLSQLRNEVTSADDQQLDQTEFSAFEEQNPDIVPGGAAGGAMPGDGGAMPSPGGDAGGGISPDSPGTELPGTGSPGAGGQ